MKALILILLFAATNAFAAWQPIGRVTAVSRAKSNVLVLATSSGAKLHVEFTDLDVVRLRMAPKGVFEREASYAIDYSVDRKTPTIAVTETRDRVTLKSATGTTLSILRRDGSMTITDASGRVVVASDRRNPLSFHTDTGEVQATMLRPSEVETYYGFGEKAFAEMSRNGKFIINWNTDTFAYSVGLEPTYQSIPYFTALYQGRAYGLFFNNTFRTWFDMGARSPERYSFGAAGGELDFYVFTGGKDRSPKEVLAAYTGLTGKTPLPPMWALGNQQSRWSYFPEARVREIAAGFRKHRIPADVLYFDIDYMDEYRVFTWDKKRFPDPPKLLADLKKDGFKSVLIIDPGIKVDPNYEVYTDGQRKGVFVKNPDGTELNRDVWPKASAFPDFTDKKARDWFGDQYKVHIAEGVDGYWNDMNEPGVFVTDKTERPEIMHHPEKTFPYDTPHKGDGFPGTHRRYHNVYGMQMARSSFEGVKRLAPEKRPFILTRAGFAGIQRYSAVWTGDNVATWDHLAMTIPMLTNLAVSGVAFAGADVGGFQDRPSPELYARWIQAGALTPFFRSHSVGWAGNKEPWEFGEEYIPINRAAVELRYQLLPYIYTLFKEHESTGAPVMRPVWYEFPNDPKCYIIGDQYMLGSDIMVTPVVKEGIRARHIYLPAGADWVNWWTGERLEGGKQHFVQAPLDRLLLFGRVGSMVPMQDVVQHTGEMPGKPITITVFAGIAPGSEVKAKLYQDRGEGYGYKQNEWRQIDLEHRQGMIAIKRYGDFQGQPIRFVEAVGLPAAPREIIADGRTVNFKFDEAKKRLRVEIPDGTKEIKLVR